MRLFLLRLSLALILNSVFLILAPSIQAQGSIGTPWSAQCQEDDVATLAGITCLFQNLLKIVIPVIGLALFLMLIWGGIKILTSGGDPKGTEAGKQTLTLAVGGLVLAILAWFILVFVSDFTGLDSLLRFDLPTL
ncbi:hypothetical protein A2W24_00415 [Microgenomates group bacterium RBG_16_45_19]|nr:MAG: hypothetical protein A2W24_00415 [Microgenomates group bacterium RBG_16_45_19]